MTAYDIAALLDQAARREQALRGSQHNAHRQTSYAGPRPDAVSPLAAPEYLWPSQMDKKPKRCTYCSSPGLSTDPPHGLVKFGETTCLLCSCVVVRWRADGTRTIREIAADLGAIAPPKRGRPPRPKPERGTCIRCDGETLSDKRQLCQVCIAAQASGGPSFRRQLVDLLSDGQPRQRHELCRALGMTRDQLRKAITRAREAGAPVTTHGRYGPISLEVGQ